MIRRTVQIGNKIVRAKSRPVKVGEIKSPKIKALVRDLADTMRHESLIGMAAPQLGVNLDVFVTEVRKTIFRTKLKKDDALRVFINPKIAGLSKKQTVLTEGCGSVAHAGLFGPVKRPATVAVRARDENGKLFVLKTGGLLAKVIQHEYDHLRGVLCIDKFLDSKKIFHKEEHRGR